MTLQSSRPISIGNIATELGIALPMNLGNATARLLAGIPSGNISIGNLLGKTRYVIVAGTGSPSSTIEFLNAATGGPIGSINNGTFNGVAINAIFTQTGPFFGINLAGLLAQNFFTSMNLQTQGATVLTANASYSQVGGNTIWKWSSPTPLISGNSYEIYLN